MAKDPITGQEIPATTGQPQFNFEQAIVGALKDPNTVDRTAIGNVLAENQKQFQAQFGDVSGTVKNAIKKDWQNFTKNGVDLGGGFKAKSVVKQNGDVGWRFYQVVDAQGNVVGETTDQTGFFNQAQNFLANAAGYGDIYSNAGGYKRYNDLIQKYGAQAGLSGITDIKSFEASRRAPSTDGNYGTFINAAGKQVVATTPEQYASSKALGFRQVAQGTTQLTPEQQATADSRRTQVEQQIQQALASGGIDQATADKLMAGQQEGDVGAGIQPNQPQQPTDSTVQMAGMAGGEDITSPSGASVNSSTGMLTTASGQKISPQDPNYQAYLSQEGLQLPSGAGAPSGQQLATGQAQTYIADQEAAQRVEEQRKALGNQLATPDLIKDLFAAYHGREPGKDGRELARYTQMGAEQAAQEIIGGAPQPFSEEERQAVAEQGFTRIENPDQLAELAKQAGFDPSKIQRIGNKMFAPPSITADVSGVQNIDNLTDRAYDPDMNANSSDLNSGEISDVANDYVSQYVSQLDPTFAETRKAYWESMLLQTDFREKKLDSLQEEFGLEDISDKLTELDIQIAAENEAWNTLQEENRNQPISITAILGREAHIKRMASIRMDGLLGQRAALAGDYDRALKHIDMAYTAAVGDHEENVQLLTDWYNENKEFFTKAEERAYNEKITAAQNEFELQKENLSDMKELMKAYPTAGISFTDSYDQAIAKAGDAYLQSLTQDTSKGNFELKEINGVIYNYDKNTGRYTIADDTQNNVNSGQIESNILNAGLATTNINGRDVTGNTYFTKILEQANADMLAAGLGGLQINQDFRTSEQQQTLYDELSATGGRVAPPGSSFHEKGLAIDVTNWQEAAPFLAKYGVVNGLPDDMGHFSMGEMNPNVFGQLDKLFPELKPLTLEAETLTTKVNLINDILTNKALDSVVGPTELTRWSLLNFRGLTGEKAGFIADVNQLISQETLGTLLNLKKEGGTLGALSEKEALMLQQAATKLGGAQVFKDGNVVGYALSEKDFEDEVKRIKNLTYNAIERAGYGHLLTQDPSTSVINFTPEEILNFYGLKNTI